MARHIKKEVRETEHTITLNQSELNTIFLLLGKSIDHEVTAAAKDWDIENFVTDARLTNLYSFFKSHSDAKKL